MARTGEAFPSIRRAFACLTLDGSALYCPRQNPSPNGGMAMPRSARDAEPFVVWALSVVVAVVFFVAGLQKLFGFAPIGLEAAAMTSFPQWIRLVVGFLE